MKVREPVARPLDVVAAELVLSASQAFLAGVLLYLAVGIWDDQGVGVGPVAVVVMGLGLAVGAGWLYWLLGGVGWPLAAANLPCAVFLGFALVLGWQADALLRIEGIPLLLSLAASLYGLVCGVFLDSPRRLRWDQRQHPRRGTPIPRVSPRTRRIVAAVPRSVPRRASLAAEEASDLRAGSVERPSGAAVVDDDTAVDAPETGPDAQPVAEPGPTAEAGDRVTDRPTDRRPDAAVGADRSAAAGEATDAAAAAAGEHPPSAGEASMLGALMPTERLGRAAGRQGSVSPAVPEESAGTAAREADGAPAIELPTSVEPRAQRSPWAWAAPPEWTRDEDDQPPAGSGRT